MKTLQNVLTKINRKKYEPWGRGIGIFSIVIGAYILSPGLALLACGGVLVFLSRNHK